MLLEQQLATAAICKAVNNCSHQPEFNHYCACFGNSFRNFWRYFCSLLTFCNKQQAQRQVRYQGRRAQRAMTNNEELRKQHCIRPYQAERGHKFSQLFSKRAGVQIINIPRKLLRYSSNGQFINCLYQFIRANIHYLYLHMYTPVSGCTYTYCFG